MSEVDQKFLERLEREAAQWAEEELTRRMKHAAEAIQEQVHISMPEIGPTRAQDHLKKALAFAEENIRMELEFEVQVWIDSELTKRKNGLKKTSPQSTDDPDRKNPDQTREREN